jgi:small-conductance mechanosensitive channel
LFELLKFEEYNSLAWDDKLLKIHSIIKTTSEIADTTKLKFPLPENYLIKRKRKLQIALSVFMAGIFTILFGYVLLTKFSTGALIVSTVLLSLIYLVLYKNLTLKKINFEIQLSKKGIAIMDKFYQWHEIQETFVIYRPPLKQKTIFFVIGLKNGILDRYHMNNLLEFNLNERAFSALIEEYRHL